MADVLIVDNSKVFTSLLANRIRAELELNVFTAHSYLEATLLVNSREKAFFIALVGLYFQDSQGGEIIDFTLSKKIPTVVFTGKDSEEMRERYISKKIVDYVET